MNKRLKWGLIASIVGMVAFATYYTYLDKWGGGVPHVTYITIRESWGIKLWSFLVHSRWLDLLFWPMFVALASFCNSIYDDCSNDEKAKRQYQLSVICGVVLAAGFHFAFGRALLPYMIVIMLFPILLSKIADTGQAFMCGATIFGLSIGIGLFVGMFSFGLLVGLVVSGLLLVCMLAGIVIGLYLPFNDNELN